MRYFCSMVRVLLLGLLLYFLYRFVFDFLIPVIRTARRVRRTLHDMQQQVHGFQQQQHASRAQAQQTQPTPGKDDYIEFEEVK